MTDTDARLAIWRLQQALGRGLATEGARILTVRCDPRPSDGDRLWFWLDRSSRTRDQSAKPLIEADNLADAVVHIHGERRNRGQHG